MAQGNFAPRSRTYHERTATSAPAYKVKRIVDEAYLRLAQPNLNETGGTDNLRLRSGILALRGVLDTINANPALTGPSEFVQYDVPLQPTLTWGLGGWDIDDQPPLAIQSLWVDDGSVSPARNELEPMSQHDLAIFRMDATSGFYYPRRYYLEETWPIRRLHLDVNEAEGVSLTPRNNAEVLTWSGGAATGRDPISQLTLDQATPQSPALLTLSLTRALPAPFVVEFGDNGGTHEFSFSASADDRHHYSASIPAGQTFDISDGQRVVRFFRRLGGPALELAGTQRETIRLNGFITKAFAIPENPSAAANYELQMPPGYFEYVLTALAIRLCSLSNKPIPDPVALAHEAARFGIRTQTNPVEPRNDLRFLSPRRYRRYHRNINRL